MAIITRAVIFANGVIQDSRTARAAIQPADLIIAANGGTHHCLALGLAPAIVIGDLDSLLPGERAALEKQGTQFVVYSRDKDQTDLELALHSAITNGAPEILLLGLLGGRLDQTLANLLLLARPEWGSTRLMVVDGLDTAWLLRSAGEIEITGRPGEIVSLIPLSPAVTDVTTASLRWPLQAARLAFGSTWGISNEMQTNSATVRIGAGLLLVIHRKQLDIEGTS